MIHFHSSAIFSDRQRVDMDGGNRKMDGGGGETEGL